jgi:hypothetical protein
MSHTLTILASADDFGPPPSALGSMPSAASLLAGPSGSRPPTSFLRRNGSSNSVLADLNKGLLSRSNSFLSPAGKPVTRSNSILSLLSGIPTALRESSSTDRLLGLDVAGEDKMLANLKIIEAGSSGAAANGASSSSQAGNGASVLGDRSLSFGQLHHIASLDDMDDAGAVALSLQEDGKWEGS